MTSVFQSIMVTSFLFLCFPVFSYQQPEGGIDSFRIYGDIKITIDRPADFSKSRKTIITFFALPNGNSTEQTMGKKLQPGDDWHFDIQHIRAQTAFIRQQLSNQNFVVIYLENNYKSWPSWKQKHPDFKKEIPHLVDSLTGLFNSRRTNIYLNGHSGGGSFIFGYLAGVEHIPGRVKRISFLDSDYGYDSSYYPKFSRWLKEVKGSALNVFAYNDSVALYNGKPVVSATGGTWYRSYLLLKHLQDDFVFSQSLTDSLIIYRNRDKRIQFFFKGNVNRGIYHTQQVELNGFIHSVLCGTKFDSEKYRYYGVRAYTPFIE
ncbi:MAG: hypothetical protein IPP43_10955 [Chitinophagaceae bacterium]|nr:hypothetical protein [Chitinophagaceae bacterium]